MRVKDSCPQRENSKEKEDMREGWDPDPEVRKNPKPLSQVQGQYQKAQLQEKTSTTLKIPKLQLKMKKPTSTNLLQN